MLGRLIKPSHQVYLTATFSSQEVTAEARPSFSQRAWHELPQQPVSVRSQLDLAKYYVPAAKRQAATPRARAELEPYECVP